MKSNILDALENRLSVNSYLWPKNIDPYEFIEAILKAGIKNIGLHIDFIEEYNHQLLVVNVKEAGIEKNVLDMLKYKNIDNFFLLDIEFPFLLQILVKF